MATVTISMPDSLREFVEAQVETGGFGNISEYFRSLLRDAQAREADARLEALLLRGLESGEDLELTREFWRHGATLSMADWGRRPAWREPRSERGPSERASLSLEAPRSGAPFAGPDSERARNRSRPWRRRTYSAMGESGCAAPASSLSSGQRSRRKGAVRS